MASSCISHTKVLLVTKQSCLLNFGWTILQHIVKQSDIGRICDSIKTFLQRIHLKRNSVVGKRLNFNSRDFTLRRSDGRKVSGSNIWSLRNWIQIAAVLTTMHPCICQVAWWLRDLNVDGPVGTIWWCGRKHRGWGVSNSRQLLMFPATRIFVFADTSVAQLLVNFIQFVL